MTALDAAALTFDALAGDPYPVLDKLREASPVFFAPSMGMWLVTRRDLILTVLRDPETYTVERNDSPIRDTFGAHMLSTDGDVQRTYKSRCAPPFNARAVREDAGPVVAARCDALLAAMAGREDRSADLRASLAGPLALYSVAHVLGLPEAMHETLRAWYDDFAAALASFDAASAERVQGRRRAEEFRGVVTRLLHERGALDARTLLGLLAHEPHERLDDAAICANALIVLFGGIETTEAAILNATWALLSHPAAHAAVRADPAKLPNAIEESMRWDPAVQTCHRYVTRDVTLGDVTIRSGATVQCMLGAANRDPALFEDPERFDISRSNAGEHLGFGTGRHFCLGAALARHEAQLAIGGLLARFPSLALDAARPSRPEGHEFRKPPALWVRW